MIRHTRPGRRHWQSAVVVCTDGHCMSQRLLPATAAPTIRQIHVIWCREDVGPDVHFLSPGLDHFNSLFYGIFDRLITGCRLFRMLLRVCCRAPVGMTTPYLCYTSCTGSQFGSRWTSTFVYLSLSSMALSYLATDCQLVSDEAWCRLRSANSRTFVIRRTYSQFGDRCCPAAGPKLWNSSPV